jgi:acyl carrier protein
VEAQVRAELLDFVVTNYLFGDSTRAPGDDDSLVEGGIIDSTGVMELIEFLESHFGIQVSDDDTVPANLDTIANLTQFVLRKQAPAGDEVVGTEDRLSG